MEDFILEYFYSITIFSFIVFGVIQLFLQRKAILLLIDEIDILKKKTKHIEENPDYLD